MVKTFSAKDAQSEFPSLLGRVRRKKDIVIVEERGQPVAAMMPFDRCQALTEKRDQLFAVSIEYGRRTNPWRLVRPCAMPLKP